MATRPCASGQFIDISAGGFRISHHDHDLRVDEELLANYGFGDLRVRIVWRHVIADRVEMGFAIVGHSDCAVRAGETTKAKTAANSGN